MGESSQQGPAEERRSAEFDALFDAHFAGIVRYIGRRIPEKGMAQDLVAETFLAAWEHIRKDSTIDLPWLFAVALLLSALPLPATPLMETPGGPRTDGVTSEQYLAELRKRLEMVDGVYLAASVIDALPNMPYLHEDGSVNTVSDSVVVGTVAAVGDVRGYIVDGERVQEASGSRPPMWQLVRVTVTVEESWGAAAGKSEVHVTFPLSSPEDLHSSIESLGALGRVLLILKDGRIVHNEEYLGLVDDAGLISYPLLVDPAAAEGLTTLADLRAALQVTREPVPVTGL